MGDLPMFFHRPLILPNIILMEIIKELVTTHCISFFFSFLFFFFFFCLFFFFFLYPFPFLLFGSFFIAARIPQDVG